MQRQARFLLWAGLAVVIVSIGSCGFGCMAALASVVEDTTDQEMQDMATNASTWGTLGLGLGLAMIVVGAVLKACSRTSREPE